MRILVVLGHPHQDSLCGALAAAYAEGAKAGGAEVRSLNLGELGFDPVLHHGYSLIQALEPDLLMAQEAVAWAEHLVFVHPVWWGGMPALLQGFFDRVFIPGFAFRYPEKGPFWDKLLKGRSAHLLLTMDSPPWYYRWVTRQPGVRQLRTAILGFCGIAPMGATLMGPVKSSTAATRERWLADARALGLNQGKR